MGFAMPRPPASDQPTTPSGPRLVADAAGVAPGQLAPGPSPTGPGAIPLPVDWRDVSEHLRRYALALCRRHDEADDLVQHTLATLLAKAPDKAGHLGYARATLTRAFLDRERSLKRRLSRTLGLARITPGFATDHAAEPDAALHDAIDALPPRQRAALVLRLVEQLDYPQIAAALDCSPEAVRSSLHVARAAVRRALEETADTGPRSSP
jgi:RNA polymerase sigma factor (sigma-70 family)